MVRQHLFFGFFFLNSLLPNCCLVVQVTLVAQGDVPLSIVMTVCSTLAAVFLTPLLTKILAGAYIPVDAVKLSCSTLQVKFLMLSLHNKKYSYFL